MSTSDGQDGETTAILEAEAARFRSLYPRSTARFAETIGKRVSHVAGPVDSVSIEERRVPVNGWLLMFVGDGDGIKTDDLARFAVQVATLLGNRGSC